MDWAPVTLLLLIIGCIAGGMTILAALWNFAMDSFDVWNTGQNLVILVSGFVSIVTLSISSIILHKKL